MTLGAETLGDPHDSRKRAHEEGTPEAWLGALAEAQASLFANVTFFMFSMGQGGVAMHFAPSEIALEMVKNMKGDRDDIATAAEALVNVCSDLIANAERNLAARTD